MKYNNYFFIISLVFTIGCQQLTNENTQTGNPFVSIAMTGSGSTATAVNRINIKRGIWDIILPKAVAYPAPTLMSDSNNNSVQLTQNWISVGEIEFKPLEVADSEEIDGTDLAFSGPFSVDLFSSSPQALAYNYISTKQIRRIKMKLSKSLTLPTGAPSDFLGKSMYLAGTVNGHTFSFTTTEETEIQIAGPSAVVPIENKILLLELKTANLIKKINLSSITSNAAINDSNKFSALNPCPSIDSSASDLYTCFKKGFETESNLGRDDDGNFKLDFDEESVK